METECRILFPQWQQIVKIRPLMDGNLLDGLILQNLPVKIRPLMDGNLFYLYPVHRL